MKLGFKIKKMCPYVPQIVSDSLVMMMGDLQRFDGRSEHQIILHRLAVSLGTPRSRGSDGVIGITQ